MFYTNTRSPVNLKNSVSTPAGIEEEVEQGVRIPVGQGFAGRQNSLDSPTGVVGAGDSREPTKELGELVDLAVCELRLKERADRAYVAARGGLELRSTGLRELCVDDAEILGAHSPLHESGFLEALEEPRDSRRGQREAPREVDALEPAPLCPRKHVQRLVAVDRQAMLSLELRIQQSRRRGVGAQEPRPGADRGWNIT